MILYRHLFLEQTRTRLSESQQPNVLPSFSTNNFDEYPKSPVERYISARCQMSYDANYEQPTTPFTPFTPQETPINIQRDNANPPLFQGISVSNQSPADDRFSVNSVIGHPSIICTQKTHDQFMKNCMK